MLCLTMLALATAFVMSVFVSSVSCCAAAWQGPTQQEWEQQQQQLLEQQQLVAVLQQQLAGMQQQHSMEQQGLRDANLALQASDTRCMQERSLGTSTTGPRGWCFESAISLLAWLKCAAVYFISRSNDGTA